MDGSAGLVTMGYLPRKGLMVPMRAQAGDRQVLSERYLRRGPPKGERSP